MEKSIADMFLPCSCLSCQQLREQEAPERPRTHYDTTFSIGSFLIPPEPTQPEPVYTHALLDYDEDGIPMGSYAELHTTESLVAAIALRADDDQRFKVFELGQQILDVRG
jgi:hypothetical protein